MVPEISVTARLMLKQQMEQEMSHGDVTCFFAGADRAPVLLCVFAMKGPAFLLPVSTCPMYIRATQHNGPHNIVRSCSQRLLEMQSPSDGEEKACEDGPENAVGYRIEIGFRSMTESNEQRLSRNALI